MGWVVFGFLMVLFIEQIVRISKNYEYDPDKGRHEKRRKRQ